MALFVLIATGAAIGVTSFLFSFENVKHLATSIGIHADIAPWISPTVDLSVVGLMVACQWLALAGVTAAELLPARRALYFAGTVMMLLNSAPSAIKAIVEKDPEAAGRSLVEAAVPALLIIWTHVGPKVIRLFIQVRERHAAAIAAAELAERTAEQAERRAAELAERTERERAAQRAAAERQAAADREAAERRAEAERDDARRREILAAAAAREAADRDAQLAREQADRAERLELARAEAARAEADRAAAQAAAEAARAEAARAAADRERAEADRLAAEALAAEVRATTRTAPARTARPDRPASTGPRPSGPRTGPRTGTRPDNVELITAGADSTREALDKIRAAYPAFGSWAELREAIDNRAPSLNDIARTTGMGKNRITRALDHAEDLGVAYRDPAAEPAAV